jgi:hypothetical protein
MSCVNAHAGQNRESCLSAHGRLPGTLRTSEPEVVPVSSNPMECLLTSSVLEFSSGESSSHQQNVYFVDGCNVYTISHESESWHLADTSQQTPQLTASMNSTSVNVWIPVLSRNFIFSTIRYYQFDYSVSKFIAGNVQEGCTQQMNEFMFIIHSYCCVMLHEVMAGSLKLLDLVWFEHHLLSEPSFFRQLSSNWWRLCCSDSTCSFMWQSVCRAQCTGWLKLVR